jgi:hypothetical protein
VWCQPPPAVSVPGRPAVHHGRPRATTARRRRGLAVGSTIWRTTGDGVRACRRGVLALKVNVPMILPVPAGIPGPRARVHPQSRSTRLPRNIGISSVVNWSLVGLRSLDRRPDDEAPVQRSDSTSRHSSSASARRACLQPAATRRERGREGRMWSAARSSGTRSRRQSAGRPILIPADERVAGMAPFGHWRTRPCR